MDSILLFILIYEYEYLERSNLVNIFGGFFTESSFVQINGKFLLNNAIVFHRIAEGY